MENEKFYVVNNKFIIATNISLNLLKKSLFREYNIKLKTIKEITLFDYLKRINNSKSKSKIRYFN